MNELRKELLTLEWKILARRWKSDINEFSHFFFKHHLPKPTPYFHREIYKVLQSSNRIAIAAPRKHAKSTIITFLYAMWKALLDGDNHFTIIISNNYANAVKYLNVIKQEIEDNPLVRKYFGDLKSAKWAENDIELLNKTKIVVGGNDFKIRGQKYLQWRPDLIIIDDAEDDELVRSEVRRKNFEHWFLYSLEPAMTAEDNQIIVIGTIIHRDSILSKLQISEGKFKNWETRLYRAINDNKALWEDNIPLDWLLKEKEKDPYRFAQEYMNNPVPFEYAMFREEYFDDYSDEDLPKDLIINITMDLACTDKEYSDYTVILPVGIDPYGDMWLLPYKRMKYADPDKIIEEMFKVHKLYAESGRNWKFGKFGVERNGFQRFLIKNFNRERKKRGLHFPIYELQAKGDKTTRIAQLQAWFSAGDIHIRADMLDLKQELLDFPRAMHDDIADSLAYQLEFSTQKPISKIEPDVKWKITPDMQFKKELKRRAAIVRPRVKVWT